AANCAQQCPTSSRGLRRTKSLLNCNSKHSLEQDSWEIVEGLRGAMNNIQEPNTQEGYLLKKRKWPLKGWHKRYFFLDKGMLKYSKTQADIQKGKLHGCIDVGLSVMSIKKKAKCVDLDTEEHIYHLKVKSLELFNEWVMKLRHHRLYRQNEIAKFPHEVTTHFFPVSPVTDSSPSSLESPSLRKVTSSLKCNCVMCVHVPWLQSSEDIDKCSKELSQCQSSLTELAQLIEHMEVIHRTYSAPAINAIQVPSISANSMRLHASNPNLSEMFLGETKHFSDVSDLPSNYSKLQEEFCHIAQEVHCSLKSAFNTIVIEKEKLKQMVSEHDVCPSPSGQMIGLKNALSTEREEHVDVTNPLVHQLSNESRVSRTDSLSEFFDAQEVLLSASSSENEASDDDSYVSDISDNISEDNLSTEVEIDTPNMLSAAQNGTEHLARRRSCLPAPGPNISNISLWNILRNNIGKDLSKVSMPVQLNEPLNTLQRLCEELEYSELLDKASQTLDPFERMVFVAAFAVSAYASTYYRAGSKPFNPVLGETYECVREDKGFRFIAEQVSHHPPISACNAESKNFVFWQDVRWKNKFWGKSIEIVPIGTVHVTLPGYGDHYEWSKVTSCIHNILSGQRWIEHYGEILIKNRNSSICQCKLTFVKCKCNLSLVSVGSILQYQDPGPPYTFICFPLLFADSVPKEFEQYYGLTKFALELNELHPDLKSSLPSTDTRFRPDQRYLEEGNTEAAESQKERIEQLQRERRRILEENNMIHQARYFRQSHDVGKESWISTETYWELRKDPGFDKLECPLLW
uniref:Oxysterol-binding protein n=1 Tax=Callorhinchus milii TaxID=7868 RepID=A0A4W3HI19_CALMI